MLTKTAVPEIAIDFISHLGARSFPVAKDEEAVGIRLTN